VSQIAYWWEFSADPCTALSVSGHAARIHRQAVAGIGNPLLQLAEALSITLGFLEEDFHNSASVTAIARIPGAGTPGKASGVAEQPFVSWLLRASSARNAAISAVTGGIAVAPPL